MKLNTHRTLRKNKQLIVWKAEVLWKGQCDYLIFKFIIGLRDGRSVIAQIWLRNISS